MKIKKSDIAIHEVQKPRVYNIKYNYLLPVLLCSAMLSACGGGGKDPILGSGGVGSVPTTPADPANPIPPTTPTPPVSPVTPPADIVNPTVTSTTPVANSTGVAINSKVSVLFSEAMDVSTMTNSTFTLATAGGNVAGTVDYTGNNAVFTPSVTLLPNTLYTGMVTKNARDVAGNPLLENYEWSFRTAVTPDTTAPTVSSTVPVNSANNVSPNTQVSAVFSEDMDPKTINNSTFSLVGDTAVAGVVSYAAASRTIVFTPSNPTTLPVNTSFIGTVNTGAKDLAGNSLAANYVWNFRTRAALDETPPEVTSTNPVDGAVICNNKTINATFSEALDPSTINNTTFVVQPSGPPLGTKISGVVNYDASSKIASFVPSSLSNNTEYTATITTGVKDLAGNTLGANKTVRFTTKLQTCVAPPALGAMSSFGSFGGNATITNDGLNTVINGDIGVNAASTKVTGFRDSGGNVYTVTLNNDGKVNGLVYTLTAPPGSVAGAAVTQARMDAQKAFDSISPAVLPGGIDVSNLAQCPSCGGAGGGADELAGRTLPAGIYLSATGTFDIGGPGRTTADLVLDAQGDANAVWIFQTAAGTGTLNVGLTGPATPAVPINIRFINGGQAKNVFWYVPAGAVINTGSRMVGTILADAAITMSTTGGSPPTAVLTVINGRAISLTAGVTMTNTVINVPAN